MDVTLHIPSWATALISDFTDMHRRPQAVDAGKERTLSFQLPDQARFEYAFLDAEGRVRADPEVGPNGENPWYAEVSELRGPNYAPHPLAVPPVPQVPWLVQRHRIESRAFESVRRVVLLSPPDARGQLPVIVLHDGIAYHRLARSGDLLAELNRVGRSCPAHLVFVEPEERLREYAWDDRHHRFVHDEVRPWVADQVATGAGWWAMGASLGALAAANLALREPDAWTGVIAQAGAFLGSPEVPRFHGVEHSWLLDQVRAGAGSHLRWLLDVGTLDWSLDINRRIRDTLDAQGTDLYYRERAAGHNWRTWRDALPEMIQAALDPHAEGGCGQRLSS